jgi:hypothetical protein
MSSSLNHFRKARLKIMPNLFHNINVVFILNKLKIHHEKVILNLLQDTLLWKAIRMNLDYLVHYRAGMLKQVRHDLSD